MDIRGENAHNRHGPTAAGWASMECRMPTEMPSRRELPTMTTLTQSDSAGLAEHLAGARRRVEEALAGYLPAVGGEDDASAGCPPRLAEAMRYSLLGGGKRLRPILALMAAEACGGEPDAALPAACALEMVHTYSLIHDDLPSMDDDDLRRGRPTCHKAFDEATAVLAGDALLTLAFEVLARDVRPPRPPPACVLALAEGAGPAGMVGGQMADLQAEGRDRRHARGPRGDPPPEDRGPAPGLAEDGGDRRRGRRGDPRRPWTSTAMRWAWPSRSSTTCSTSRGTRRSWASGSQGSRPGEVDLPRAARPRRQPPARAGQLADEAVAALRAPRGTRGARLRALALDLLERDR